jgi:hypothetical protein
LLNEKERPKGCLNITCWDHRGCARCGFNVEEDARRKQIPLTLCEDGLRRKLIPPKPPVIAPVQVGGEPDES